MKIVNENQKINKFLEKLNITFYLTPTQVRYLVLYMYFYFEITFNAKIKNIDNVYFCNTDRSSINRFLTRSPWDEEKILRVLRSDVIKTIQNISTKTKEPIQLVIDDTISKKTKPSSKALNTIQGTQFHYSHTEKRHVFGHQIFVCILKCGNRSFPFEMMLYNKNTSSKIDMALSVIKTVCSLIKVDYLLTDSWYSSKKIIKEAIKNNIIYVGALRTNRVIYPNGKKSKGVKISAFAISAKRKNFNLVTVNGIKYHTYRYVGKINGVNNVCVVITYPYGKFGNKKSLKAFIASNTQLMTTDILHTYSERWCIEEFIRECKGKLGLNNYQIYNLRGIRRYYIISMITYYYITCRNKKLSFPENYNNIKNNVHKNFINFVYKRIKDGYSIDKLLESLKIA